MFFLGRMIFILYNMNDCEKRNKYLNMHQLEMRSFEKIYSRQEYINVIKVTSAAILI